MDSPDDNGTPPVTLATDPGGRSAPASQEPGMRYFFPVEITVVADQSPPGEVHYHFPVEIALTASESSIDANTVADLVFEKLARQLESQRRERG